MKLVWYFMLLGALLAAKGYCQEAASFPRINDDDLPGAHFLKGKGYSGSSLFGYMNGGAELFLEYGCSAAWISELQFNGSEFKIELYKMNSPEEAFGIYSVSRFQCLSSPPLSPYTCLTSYQLQFCKGPYYVNIINNSGNKSDSLASIEIGKAIAAKITEAPANIGLFVPGKSSEAINRDALLVKGELGIMNGAPDLAFLFSDLKDYVAVIMQNGENTIISLKFTSETGKDIFIRRHFSYTESGKTFTSISENHILFTLP